MATDEVKLKEAAVLTGMSTEALRMMAKRGRIRWRQAGKYVVLFRPDVEVLASRRVWRGNAVVA